MRRLLAGGGLRRRLIVSVMLVFCLPMLLLGAYLVRTIEGKLYDGAVLSARGTLRHMGRQITDTLRAAENFATLLATDTRLSAFVSRTQTDAETVKMVNGTLLPFAEQIKVQNPAIRGLRVLHSNPSLFDVRGLVCRLDDLETALAPLRAPGRPYALRGWRYAALEETGGARDENVWLVSCVAPLTSFLDPQAVIQIVVDNARLFEEVSRESAGEPLLLLCGGAATGWTEAGAAYRGAAAALAGEGETRLPGGTAVLSAVEGTDATLCLVIPATRTSLSGYQRTLAAGVMLAALSATAFLVWLAVGKALRKLAALSRRMDAVQAAAPALLPPPAPGQDEIDRLDAHFTGMYSRLQDAFEREKSLIFDDLTNQLKPHFLCNAMDMLRLQALRLRQDELAESVGRINQYFRYSMLRTEHSVPLWEECDNAANYMLLVNGMREDKIAFDIDMDAWTEEHAHRLRIPKMLLQPLLENAVRHGVKQKKFACVTLTIRREDGGLLIAAQDNGAGMDADTLARVRRQAEGAGEEPLPGERRHIGLSNIRNRLALLYGEGYRLTITSAPLVGTVVEIRLDIRPEDVSEYEQEA